MMDDCRGEALLTRLFVVYMRAYLLTYIEYEVSLSIYWEHGCMCKYRICMYMYMYAYKDRTAARGD